MQMNTLFYKIKNKLNTRLRLKHFHKIYFCAMMHKLSINIKIKVALYTFVHSGGAY